MSRSLALFLTDFGRAPSLPGLPDFADDDEALAGPTLAEQLAEARAGGLADGEEAARAAAAAEVAVLEAAHAEALEAARAEWAAGQGEALAAALRDGLAAIETETAEALAAVLEPVLHAAARDRALAEARDALGALLGGSEGRLVTVRGPADLIEALRPPGAADGALAFEAAEGCDLAVLCGDTTIRSALASWAERLRSAMVESL